MECDLDQPLLFTFVVTMLCVLAPFAAYHWYITLIGRTSLEVCRDDPIYEPSSSYATNLFIVFGTRNPVVCLMPRVSVLPLWGDHYDDLH